MTIDDGDYQDFNPHSREGSDENEHDLATDAEEDFNPHSREGSDYM